MKKDYTKITYAPPMLSVSYLVAERYFCNSGNLPGQINEDDLFDEDFN